MGNDPQNRAALWPRPEVLAHVVFIHYLLIFVVHGANEGLGTHESLGSASHYLVLAFLLRLHHLLSCGPEYSDSKGVVWSNTV